jgi:hypothetical protein
MKKKAAFTGMLAAVFALAVTGSLAAQARAVRPPREFVGTWHYGSNLRGFRMFCVIEIGADGSILMEVKFFDNYGEDITAMASDVMRESGFPAVLRVIRVDSRSKIVITDPKSGGTKTWELIGQSLVAGDGDIVFKKGEPRP